MAQMTHNREEEITSCASVAAMWADTHWNLRICTGVFRTSLNLVILTMLPVAHETFTEMATVLKCLYLVTGI
jgi:hypothetical protein